MKPISKSDSTKEYTPNNYTYTIDLDCFYDLESYYQWLIRRKKIESIDSFIVSPKNFNTFLFSYNVYLLDFKLLSENLLKIAYSTMHSKKKITYRVLLDFVKTNIGKTFTLEQLTLSLKDLRFTPNFNQSKTQKKSFLEKF